jgi:hypothetical protein
MFYQKMDIDPESPKVTGLIGFGSGTLVDPLHFEQILLEDFLNANLFNKG